MTPPAKSNFLSDTISGVGYGTIPGWIADTASAGLNTSSGPCANSGTIPDGSRLAFVQTNSSTANLSTTITDLTPGTLYRVTFRANVRSGFASMGLSVFVNDGATAVPISFSFNQPVSAIPALSPASVYHTISFTFTANAPTAALKLRKKETGYLLANRLLVGEPQKANSFHKLADSRVRKGGPGTKAGS